MRVPLSWLRDFAPFEGDAADIAATEAQLAARATPDALAVLRCLRPAREAFESVVDCVLVAARQDVNGAYAGSVPYLLLAGNLMAGWQLARALLAAEDLAARGEQAAFAAAKSATARFYAEHLLARIPGQRDSIVHGAASVTAMALEAF